jgi:hypothetical protein
VSEAVSDAELALPREPAPPPERHETEEATAPSVSGGVVEVAAVRQIEDIKEDIQGVRLIGARPVAKPHVHLQEVRSARTC